MYCMCMFLYIFLCVHVYLHATEQIIYLIENKKLHVRENTQDHFKLP